LKGLPREDSAVQKTQIRTGIDQLASERFSALKGKRVGLLMPVLVCAVDSAMGKIHEAGRGKAFTAL